MRKKNGVAVTPESKAAPKAKKETVKADAPVKKDAKQSATGKTTKADTSSKKEPKHDPLALIEGYVKQYLDGVAAKDPVFARKYHKGDKTVHGAVLYIIQQEYKQAVEVKVPGVSKCKFAGNSDQVHYGWAMHYFDEDDIKEVTDLPAEAKQAMSMAAQSSESSAPAAKTVSRKPSASSKPQPAKAQQTSSSKIKSFDFNIKL